MAESEKKVVSGTPVSVPAESNSASLLVKTAWPHASFTVAGVPEVTAEGTKLTKAQFDQVEKAAGPSGVTLEVEDVN